MHQSIYTDKWSGKLQYVSLTYINLYGLRHHDHFFQRSFPFLFYYFASTSSPLPTSSTHSTNLSGWLNFCTMRNARMLEIDHLPFTSTTYIAKIIWMSIVHVTTVTGRPGLRPTCTDIGEGLTGKICFFFPRVKSLSYRNPVLPYRGQKVPYRRTCIRIGVSDDVSGGI